MVRVGRRLVTAVHCCRCIRGSQRESRPVCLVRPPAIWRARGSGRVRGRVVACGRFSGRLGGRRDRSPSHGRLPGRCDRSPPDGRPLGPAAGQAAQATNRAGGMPPRLPLLKRHVLAVRLSSQRMLSISDVPALAVLDGLLHRPIPGAATLDRGRTFPEVPRPFRPEQLDRAGVGALAPCLHAPHVRPRSEPRPGRAGVRSSEGPSGGDQPAGVPGRVGKEPDGGVGEPGGQVAGGFGGFGGVLGQVSGHVLFGDLRAGQPAGDGERSDLRAPLDDPAVGSVRMPWSADRGRGGGADQEPIEQLGGRPTREREHRFRVVGVVAVKPEQGVQVHGAAGLEFGDLGVTESGRDAAVLGGPTRV